MVKKILLICLFVTSVVSAQFPTNNLIVQYGFNNGSVLVDGVNGGALSVSGTTYTEINDRFNVAPTSAVKLSGSSFNTNYSTSNSTIDTSISFWVKTSEVSSDSKIIFEKSSRGNAASSTNMLGYSVRLENGKIRVENGYEFTFYNGLRRLDRHSAISNRNVSDGEWHHIVVSIFNRSDNIGTSKGVDNFIRIYVDGALDTNHKKNKRPNTFLNRQLRVTNGHSQNVRKFQIANLNGGNAPANYKYANDIDDVLVYGRLLTATEINNIGSYNNFCRSISAEILSASNVTEDTININISGSQAIDVAYHKIADSFSSATIITNKTGSFTLNNTSPSTYKVYVRRNCGASTTSPWSEYKIFKNERVPVYVNKNATGRNDGSSWVDAFVNLNDALTEVYENNEIWVAKGTYLPSTSGRSNSFTISKKGIKIYGSFAGTETEVSQRNINANRTVLSGDLLGNDNSTLEFTNTTRNDNSYHIIKVNNDDVVLDGLTIQGGHANGTASDDQSGGAIFKGHSVINLEIANCIIDNNVSTSAAAAILSRFEESGYLKIRNTIVKNNLSRYGTAIYSYTGNNKIATIKIKNSVFDNNIAKDNGTNKGHAGSAGWFRAYGTGSTMNCDLINNTYVNNVNLGTTSGLNNFNRSAVGMGRTNGVFNGNVANCIFWKNTTTGGVVSKSIAQVHTTLGQNITVKNSIGEDSFSNLPSSRVTNVSNSDPLFTDLANNDVSLTTASPAKDTGDNAVMIGASDVIGNVRIHNGTVDMGAYEFGASTYVSRMLKIKAENGSVTANPVAVDGGYSQGTSVVLTATPDAGYKFDGWASDASGTTNPLTVVMNSDKTITAKFSRIKYTLTVTSTNGTVTTNPNPVNGKYNEGQVVALNATPNPGYQFDGWTGDATGIANSVNVTMNSNKTVTAKFSVICIVSIPDVNFKNGLLNHTPKIDINNDGKIQCTEANAFTGTLSIRVKNISDLTGIEEFKNITKFNFERNKLTSIDLSSNTALTEIDCSQQQASLTTLILPQTGTLTKVNCFNNDITALDLSGNPNMIELKCSVNKIVTLNTTGLTKLIKLDAQINKISSLDLTTNTALKELISADNELTAINVSSNIALEVLNCRKNNISSLNLSNNTSLKTVNIYQTLISSLDVSQNSNLTGVDARNSKLTSLNVANGNNTQFIYMTVTGNPNLSCIQIDSGFTPTSVWNKDATASYSVNCTAKYSLTVNATNGTVTTNPNPTNGKYDDGTSVVLTATPNAGYQFDGWSGDASGTTNPVTVVMNANKTVTATFSKIQRTLTINGTNGTVTTNPNPTNGKYDDGTSVVLTAMPNAGYQFDGWSGDASGTTNPVTIVMNTNKTVTATFSKIQRILTINATNGVVTTNPNPTNGKYDDGTSVVLTAMPNAGYQFDGWSGDASGTTNPVTVVMNANKTVTATFSKIQRTLTINASNGAVTTNPNPTSGTYDDGTSVVLTAMPNAGYQFDGWSGDASGTSNPLTVVMSGDKTVTAMFSRIMRTLTVTKAGNGTVTTNPNVTGGYVDGTNVTLTATPESGWKFDGWSGDASGTTNQITVTMNANKSITATFSQVTAGIEDEKKLKDFAVYPNPVETILRLQLNEQVKEITIYSIQGREVKTSKEREINISDLSSGIYLIKVQTDNDKIGIKKFVKK
ncbi:InlB B-repeat-containing protein [Tenacibaculum halocynthiae]|uniref:InlB B-repeat-containing protein n=1 Tax=Tenacibaculum halocynthiae TaxID=1254437 RepID=UPI003893BC9C